MPLAVENGERLQRQRKKTGFVRGRADEPAQIGQIKQPHLNANGWLPRRQAHSALKQRLRADADAQHQSDETADQKLHKVNSFKIDPRMRRRIKKVLC